MIVNRPYFLKKKLKVSIYTNHYKLKMTKKNVRFF